MRDSLIILLCFAAGIVISLTGVLPETADLSNWTEYMLYLLLFSVGLGLGMDSGFLKAVRYHSPHSLLLPFTTIFGTLAGACAAYLFMLLVFKHPPINLLDSISATAGYGYYSLSSVMLSEPRGPQVATIALAGNMIREVLTLLLAPVIYKVFGPYALISSGGATSMDTTLGVCVKNCGSEFAPLSIYHGFFLTAAVPFIITLLLSLY